VRLAWLLACLVPGGACEPAAREATQPVRLVERFNSESLHGPRAPTAATAPVEWRFADVASGWGADLGVRELHSEGARLVGVADSAVPLLLLTRVGDLGPHDRLHAVEVRARVSAGSRIAVRVQAELPSGGLQVLAQERALPFWGYEVPLEPGDRTRTYRIPAEPQVTTSAQTRHVVLSPTDAQGARFEVESVRLIFRREHLASLASGPGWHGLGDIWRESLLARPGQSFVFEVDLPMRAWLDLGLGSVDAGALTFRVTLTPSEGEAVTLLQRTLTTPERWEPAGVDLADYAGRRVHLTLSVEGSDPAALGLFGSPAVRSRAPPEERAQAVILIVADSLRSDHLDAYGYRRKTAPNLARVAEEGALFADTLAPATWTLPSVPSILTGLHPRSHGVVRLDRKLSPQAQTLPERLREAGYATVAYSSAFFTGRFNNLHQGFEEVHEKGSLPESEGYPSKTARAYVDRLLEYMDAHAEVPFFAMLHVFDPHQPFEPRPPYASLWADARRKPVQRRDLEQARPWIGDPTRRRRGVPGEADLRAAGVDPRLYIEHELDWYDGSIRGLDAELVRVFEKLESLGLAERSVVVLTSDHGEEFHEHGQMLHGHSLHSELLRVPLVFWAPGRVPPRTRVEPLVQTVDLLPTLLELVGLGTATQVHGRSLVPYLHPRVQKPPARAAFAEKPLDPWLLNGDVASEAVHSSRWKLVRHTRRPDGRPELELYDRVEDPFERRNLANQAPEVAAELLRQLETWSAEAEVLKLPAQNAGPDDLDAEARMRLRAPGDAAD
jgi:arylsulfatase A-like enzyme